MSNPVQNLRQSGRAFCLALGLALLPGVVLSQSAVTTNAGTTTSIPVFTGTYSVAPSNLYQANGNIGIATSNPVSSLHIITSVVNPFGGVNQSVGTGNVLIEAHGNSRSPSSAAALAFAVPANADGSNLWEQGRIAVSPDNSNNSDANGRMYLQTRYNSGSGWMWRSNLTLTADGNTSLSGGLRFPDGTFQSTAFPSPDANGITPIVASNAVGFQLGVTTQTIAGAISDGGNLSLRANPLASPSTGGSIFLGGSARGDAMRAKVWLTGNAASPTATGLIVNASDNVGIGLQPSADPSSRLEVNGSVTLSAGSGGSITFPDSTVQSTAWNGVLTGGDYAESVDVAGSRDEYSPGDVMVIDPDSEGRFVRSTSPYASGVTGVFSTRPGVVGRRQLTGRAAMKEEVPMAMTGIVPTRVTTENGPIKPGDLLVTSSIPGHAMKGTDRTLMLGAVIGKAIGHLDSGAGLIEAVISLQ